MVFCQANSNCLLALPSAMGEKSPITTVAAPLKAMSRHFIPLCVAAIRDRATPPP
jgi:hypothetical protein